nr:hypothetical protein [Dongshaea marina]
MRIHSYHLLVSGSPNNEQLDASITARGLHGEAYRGHIFWDEIFMLPFYDVHFPDTARQLLMYRYKRLDAARAYAREHGYRGAMFPWQSGSDGTEETQTVHLNPVSGKWGMITAACSAMSRWPLPIMCGSMSTSPMIWHS